jgi:hypothetical protein
MAMGPPRNIDISPSVGPFRFLGDTIRPWLWAHSRISTSLFWLAHSGLSALIFGDGYGPTQEYRHLPFSGPIQVSRRHYLAMAVGPFKNIDIFVLVGPLGIIDTDIRRWLWAHPGISKSPLQWAHSGFSVTLFGDGCGPIQEYRHLCFGRPTRDYRH